MNVTRLGVVTLIGLALVGGGTIAGVRHHRSTATMVSSGPAPDLRAPDSVRIRVQVLNGTKTRGLARRATMLLRDRGFDVVEVGTIDDSRDSTLVVDLSGHPEWAKRAAAIMSPAVVQSRPDTSRYLDIAVVLGTSWRPPSKPFYP